MISALKDSATNSLHLITVILERSFIQMLHQKKSAELFVLYSKTVSHMVEPQPLIKDLSQLLSKTCNVRAIIGATGSRVKQQQFW